MQNDQMAHFVPNRCHTPNSPDGHKSRSHLSLPFTHDIHPRAYYDPGTRWKREEVGTPQEREFYVR
jgi:hypothetical protein